MPRSLPSTDSRTHRQRGFTAIELMIVVGILGILVALAAPSFQPLIERWRVRSAAESLEHGIYTARSKAFQLGGDIVIVGSPSTATCTSTGLTDWKCGFIVFQDRNNNNVQDACNTTPTGECTLWEAPFPPSIEFTAADFLRIDRWGVMTNDALPLTSEIKAKGRDMDHIASAKVCIPRIGAIKRVKGTESC